LRSAVAEAQARYETAMLHMNHALASNDGTEAGVQRVQADYWKAELGRTQQLLERAGLRSPIDGVVATPHVDTFAGRKLLQGDTFAEVVDRPGAPSRSDCHAWSASPNIEIFRTVLGVDSAAPGFRRVSVRPHLGKLKSAAGAVPKFAEFRGEVYLPMRALEAVNEERARARATDYSAYK
jgi:hypothetical protein